MSDPTRPAPVRPMNPADYEEGQAVPARAPAAHPNRDIVIGAVVGAVALWGVPKALDFLTGLVGFGEDEYELEPDDEQP